MVPSESAGAKARIETGEGTGSGPDNGMDAGPAESVAAGSVAAGSIGAGSIATDSIAADSVAAEGKGRDVTVISRRQLLGYSAAAFGGGLLCDQLAAQAGPLVQGRWGQNVGAWAGGVLGADAAPPPPHLGSLAEFIRSQAVKGEFPLSFLREEFTELADWKQTVRRRVLELLHYSPPACPPRAEVIEKVDCGSYVREKIVFNTTPDLRVPGYVLVPHAAGKRPAPAIIALHSHDGFYLWGKEKLVEVVPQHEALTTLKNTVYGGASIADELAKQGYVVAVIDMFYWGERRLLLEKDAADWKDRPADLPLPRVQAFHQRAAENEQLVGRAIFAAGFTWPGVMIWDDIRTLDYLLTRPEVDPKRIGCVGLSIGGLRACHLAALDERIKAAVVVGWMASFPAQLDRHIRSTIGFTKLIPGLYKQLDYPDLASLAMPTPLMVINGLQDPLFELEGVKASFDKLARCYKKAGVPERFSPHLYDTPHQFNRDMQTAAWAWFRRWL